MEWTLELSSMYVLRTLDDLVIKHSNFMRMSALMCGRRGRLGKDSTKTSVME